jgi:hypothetical protein
MLEAGVTEESDEWIPENMLRGIEAAPMQTGARQTPGHQRMAQVSFTAPVTSQGSLLVSRNTFPQSDIAKLQQTDP